MSDSSPHSAGDSFESGQATNSASAYSGKGVGYFRGARFSFVDQLPTNPAARLLEVGCATGDTGAYAKSQEKCGWCCGIELCEGPGNEAKTKLDQVLIGDIERLDLPFAPAYFDTLLLSEVLEHLSDPWAVLRKLSKLLKPGAIVLAGSPNVSHYSVILMLLKGNWEYHDAGVMDATHLRWFTPKSYRQMFEACGYSVEFVRPAIPLGRKAKLVNWLLFRNATHLLCKQIVLRARKPV
jgi:2-polyprenyl-3-methyl-5-hydroxy-6-metoxy-1,4-benzoquinol methylase